MGGWQNFEKKGGDRQKGRGAMIPPSELWIQEGFSGFLKQVESLIKLLNLCDSQKDSVCGSSILTLKSSNKIISS